MSVQPSVASYFGKRKRLAADKGFKSKIIKTENDFGSISSIEKKNTTESTIVSVKKHKSGNDKFIQQMDIREALKKCEGSPVKFQLMGSLSPLKKNSHKVKINESTNECDVIVEENLDNEMVCSKSKMNSPVRNLGFSNNCSTEDVIRSARELVSKIRETRKKLTSEDPKKKELSLNEIKDKIIRSTKLTELKKSISKINQQAEELIEVEKRKLTGATPKLSKFKSFEIEVPVSPGKQNQRSPSKPAYERYGGLVDSPITTLPLPFSYQKLYDFFCATDTICSMIINRGEILTFNKIKPAVEEMTRKTFTTRHLGQIATVCPDAFVFSQEKLRNFGSTSKADRYELVITPVVPKNSYPIQGSTNVTVVNKEKEDIFKLGERKTLTPVVIKKRKEIFYRNLLEKAKDHHEEFLKTLDPPIVIDRNDIRRWHPSFMVDFVPDIEPQDLPQPPNSERPATAKQVLERAKEFLTTNVRLQKALEAAAKEGENHVKSSPALEIAPEVKAKVDARLKDPLRGIPKCLLEKVRAKQAAKALDAMQMTPEEEKETLVYMRLPDMARIVRTSFINEQKGVLPLEDLMEKVQFSCNRHFGLREVETHIRLLIRLLPEWLSIIKVRNLDFVKINRNADVASVMTKLGEVVEERKKKGGKNLMVNFHN